MSHIHFFSQPSDGRKDYSDNLKYNTVYDLLDVEEEMMTIFVAQN